MIRDTITICILNRCRCSTIILIKRIVDTITIGIGTCGYRIGNTIPISVMAFYRIRNTVIV